MVQNINDNDSDSPEHFRLAPSSAGRWINCPGSARTDLPDRPNRAAQVGTLAHAMGLSRLNDEPMSDEDMEQFAILEVTEEEYDEMVIGVQQYVEFVRGIPGDYKIYEVKRESKALPGEHGGTIDALIVTDDSLYVVDLKYGLMAVSAFDNKQLACYLNLAREDFPGRKRFMSAIIQPRVFDEASIHEFTETRLDEVAIMVIEAAFDDSLHAGEWCQWCPLLQMCDVAYAAANKLADIDFEEVKQTDDVEQLIQIKEFAPVVSQLAKLAGIRMMELLQIGVVVPGYKAIQGLKNREWRDEKKAWEILKLEYPELVHKMEVPAELKSPAQIEKVIAKTKLADLDLYHRPQGAIRLVEESTKGEPVDFSGSFEVIDERY